MPGGRQLSASCSVDTLELNHAFTEKGKILNKNARDKLIYGCCFLPCLLAGPAQAVGPISAAPGHHRAAHPGDFAGKVKHEL